MEKNDSIDYEAIQREFARVIEQGLNVLGDRAQGMSWFCTIEEKESETKNKAA
jgi:hypothetical protein